MIGESTCLVSTNKGIIISISGHQQFPNGPKQGYDPVSGYNKLCDGQPVTVLLLIDPKSGVIQIRQEINSISIKNIKVRDDARIFAAAQFSNDCVFLNKGDAAILEIDTDLKAKIIFLYGGPISKLAHDITFLPNGNFALVGDMNILFEPDDVPPKWTGTPIIDSFTGEFFKRDSKTMDAFIVVVSPEGELIKDKIIGDLRGRSLRSIVNLKDGGIIAGGMENGTSGWIVSFSWQ